jgi:hypothetical protein
MVLRRESMTEANYQRWERGLPPIKETQPKKEDPALPIVTGQLRLDDIPNEPMRDIGVRRHNVKNEEGMRFIGYDLCLVFEGGESVEGWLLEADFEQLKRRIPQERSDLLKKVSL